MEPFTPAGLLMIIAFIVAIVVYNKTGSGYRAFKAGCLVILVAIALIAVVIMGLVGVAISLFHSFHF